MAKKGKQLDIPIKAALLKSPRAVIQSITSNIQGLKFTKVIQTYVMESSMLKIQLLREGRPFSKEMWFGLAISKIIQKVLLSVIKQIEKT